MKLCVWNASLWQYWAENLHSCVWEVVDLRVPNLCVWEGLYLGNQAPELESLCGKEREMTE